MIKFPLNSASHSQYTLSRDNAVVGTMNEANSRVSKVMENLKHKYTSSASRSSNHQFPNSAKKSINSSSQRLPQCQGNSLCVCFECDDNNEAEEICKLKKKLKKAKTLVKQESLSKSLAQVRTPLVERINIKPDKFSLHEEVDLMENLMGKYNKSKDCSCATPIPQSKDLSKYEKKIEKLKEQVYLARGQRREWEAKLSSFEPQKLELERRIKTLESQKKAIDDEKTRAILAERKATSKLQALVSGSSLKDNEFHLLQKRIEDLEREKSALMSELARIKSKFVYLEAEVNGLRSEREKLRIEFEEKERILKCQVNDILCQNTKILDDLQITKIEREKLGERLRIMKLKKKDLKLELNSILDRIPHLERDRANLISEFERLRHIPVNNFVEKIVEVPIHSVQPNNHVIRLENEVAALRAEVASLQASRKELNCQNEGLRMQLNSHSQNNNLTLISERDSLRNRLHESERFINELQTTKNQLLIQIENLTKSNSQKNVIVSNYMEELANRNLQFERNFH